MYTYMYAYTLYAIYDKGVMIMCNPHSPEGRAAAKGYFVYNPLVHLQLKFPRSWFAKRVVSKITPIPQSWLAKLRVGSKIAWVVQLG